MKNIIKWNKSHDINGNIIAKVFYTDGTTKILRTRLLYSLTVIPTMQNIIRAFQV